MVNVLKNVLMDNMEKKANVKFANKVVQLVLMKLLVVVVLKVSFNPQMAQNAVKHALMVNIKLMENAINVLKIVLPVLHRKNVLVVQISKHSMHHLNVLLNANHHTSIKVVFVLNVTKLVLNVSDKVSINV